MLGVLLPTPLQCHGLSGLHWNGNRAVSAQQARGITRLFVEDAKVKVIIIACLEHTGHLWQISRTLPEILMAAASFLPSVLIFRFLHAPFLSFTLVIRKVELLQLSLSFLISSSYSYLFCSLFLFAAIWCTELLWKSAAAGEGWTCLEMAAIKARLSSITRPLNLLWEFLKLPLSALQREVQGEALAPLFLLLMTQTGITSPPMLPALG